MKNFILILQFLTRIPININIKAKEDDFAKGVVYFPIVGLIIGAFNFGIYYLASLVHDGLFAIVCSILANVIITGALHVDGLADTCDGIYSSRTKERMLEIMKDSRIGTNGTIAIIFDFAIRISLLYNAPKVVLYYALLLSPVVSRSILVMIMKISRYARVNGMGGLFIGKQSVFRTIIAVFLGMVISYIILGWLGLEMLVVCILIALLFRLYIYSKIGGMTGDTVGATNEVLEICFIILIVLAKGYALI